MLFYKGLHSKKTVQGVDLNNMLHGHGIPQVEERDKERLEGPITYDELLFGLKMSANNTSTGFHCFTYEFKKKWIDLGCFMWRAINASYEKGELSESMKRGVISCIPKGNKAKALLKNWRPISLLNTTYKLASLCIAERLKSVLPKIINEDKTGFISGGTLQRM